MSSLSISVNAVMPFVIYIGYGIFLNKAGIAETDFMKKVNRMVYKSFYPFLIFYNLYNAGENLQINGLLIGAVVALVMAIVFITAFVTGKIVPDVPRRPTIIQALFRSNTLLFAMPLAENIYGPRGAAVAVTALAVIVPFFNILSILVFEVYRGGKVKIGSLLKNIFTNPIIMGAMAGFFFVITGIKLPGYIVKPISNFSSLTTPLACVILGTQLKMNNLKKDAKALIIILTTRLVLLPAISLPIALALGFGNIERFVFFSIFATPCATASFPMARNMGGDGDLAAELVATSTIMSVVTIFFWVLGMNTVGMLF